jgi:hypothetical protein
MPITREMQDDDDEESGQSSRHGYSEEVLREIDHLVMQRSEHRRLKEWDLSDKIYRKLGQEPYAVEIIDCADASDGSRPSEWRPLSPKEPVQKVTWKEMQVRYTNDTNGTANTQDQEKRPPITTKTTHLPFIIATVDSPQYQRRFEDTMVHLREWQLSKSQHESCLFEIEKCFMLDLVKQHPPMDVKRKHIVFEGWRQILLPMIAEKFGINKANSNNGHEHGATADFVLVAEDDIRFPDEVTSKFLYEVCQAAFSSNPDIDIVSLGHLWKDMAKHNKSSQHQASIGSKRPHLNEFLLTKKNGSAGIHGATLMAIRNPLGVENIFNVLNKAASKRQQTHLDQFLFHSFHHNLPIAFSDPPLAGWADVETTLTPAGMGHRRRGGGRPAFIPNYNYSNSTETMAMTTATDSTTSVPTPQVRWVTRYVSTTPPSAKNCH